MIRTVTFTSGERVEEGKNNSKKSGRARQFKLPHIFSRRLIIGLIIILVGGGLFAGYWWGIRTPGLPKDVPSYKQTNTYILTGEANGTGIKVTKPVQLGGAGKSPDKTNQINFSQTDPFSNQGTIIAQLDMASLFSVTPISQAYRGIYSQTISDPKSAGYASMVKPIEAFVTDRVPIGYKVTFSQPRNFTTSNVKNSAWSLDFTATAKDSKQGQQLPDLTGKVILAMGTKAFYYILLDASTINWNANHQVWRNLLNSIQLDQ